MPELMEIDGEYLNDTGKAVLIDYEGEEIWLPKSQIEYWPDKPKHREVIQVELPIWLAEKKGMA